MARPKQRGLVLGLALTVGLSLGACRPEDEKPGHLEPCEADLSCDENSVCDTWAAAGVSHTVCGQLCDTYEDCVAIGDGLGYECGPGGGLANIPACYLTCDLCAADPGCPEGMECVTAGDGCPLIGRCYWPVG